MKNKKPLVLVVENSDQIKTLMASFFERAGIACIVTSCVNDGLELFMHNEDILTHIAIDGLSYQTAYSRKMNSMPLARAIARSKKFEGDVYVISEDPDCYEELSRILKEKHIRIPENHLLKIKTTQEMIKRITAPG